MSAAQLLPVDGYKIPEISNDHLADLVRKVRVLRIDSKGRPKPLRVAKECLTNPRGIAFTWATSPRLVYWPLPKLTVIHSFVCYHNYGYYGFFKPSLAEVFAQIPSDIADQAYGFTLEVGDTYCALTEDDEHQWSTVAVYGKASLKQG